MKKTFLFVVGCLMLATSTFLACSKSDSPVEAKSSTSVYDLEPDEYTLDDLMLLPLDEMRLIFNLMSPATRASIWQEKIDRVIATETDSERISALQALRALITPGIYIAETDDHENAKIAAASWVESNMELFGKNRLAQIVSDPHPDPSSRPNVPGGGTTQVTCECSMSSDWCIDDQFVYEYNCKSGQNCSTTNWGCGTLGLFGCKGMCQRIFPR